MKKFLSNNLKLLITIAITAIICISGSVYATIRITADQIEYKDTTVDQALDSLYNTSNEMIANLNNQLNAPFTYYLQVESQSSSYNAIANINNVANNWSSKYSKLKYVSATNNSYDSTCVLRGNNKNTGSWDIIAEGTTVNLSDYNNFFVAVKSTTNGQNATCRVQIQFFS